MMLRQKQRGFLANIVTFPQAFNRFIWEITVFNLSLEESYAGD